MTRSDSRAVKLEDSIFLNPNFRRRSVLVSYLTSSSKVRDEEFPRRGRLYLLKYDDCTAKAPGR